MPYQMKPSAKWIIAGLTIGHLSMFLLFLLNLLDLLYLLWVLPQRLIPLSRDQRVALGFLFLLLPLICSGSFLISVAQSLRTIHRENRRTDAPHAD